MKKKRVEITDRTLVELFNIYGDALKQKASLVRELTELIYIFGADYIEITPDLYDILCPLPKGIEFRINVKKQMKLLSSNRLEKEILKNYNTDDNKNLRIVGLDDLILYDYEEKFSFIKSLLGENVEMLIGDEYGCSTALALEWIKCGGKNIITSFTGIGKLTPLEQLFCSLEFLDKKSLRGNQTILPKIIELFEEITNVEVEENKPFIGKKIFDVESGVHVDGIIKNPKNFEPYEPSKIGKQRKIIIGKFSGTKSIEFKLQELNVPYSMDKIELILDEVRSKSMKERRSLKDSEFLDICEKVGA